MRHNLRLRGYGFASALSAAFLCIGLCASCSNLLSGSAARTGSLSISLGARSAKTVVASDSDYSAAIAAYRITVSGHGNSYASSAVSGGVCTIAGIVAGTGYAVDVKAYSDSGATAQIAEGSASIDITVGATASATVALSFTQSGSGGIALPIQWPDATGLPYVLAKLDDASSTPIFSATATGSPYTATIAKAGIASGQHHLYVYFAASPSATALVGPFIESVTIWDGVTNRSWASSTGTVKALREFDAAEFASTNASLAGLTTTGATLAPGFAPSTTTYSLSTGFAATSFSIVAQAVVGTQKLDCSWNGTAQSWASIDGSAYSFSSASLGTISGTNTLVITVTAPDKQTKKSYTFYVYCGSSAINISNAAVSYSGLGLASSASVVQGQAYSLAPGTSYFAAIASGWTWYLDGVARSDFTGPSFSLSPEETSAMLGGYTISASVVSGGVPYSGSLALTVANRSSLSLSATPTVSLLAGSAAAASGTTDDSGMAARFNNPVAIATDGANLYVADFGNNAIRKIVISSGAVTTIAGSSGGSGFVNSSSGNSATFHGPDGLAIAGNYLYVAELSNHAIRKVSLSPPYAVTTLAGSGSVGSADGTGTAASFQCPAGLATDGSYLYVADQTNNKIRKIDLSSAAVTTFAGPASGSTTSGFVDGTGAAARFSTPVGLAISAGWLYVSDYFNHAIRRIDLSSGEVATVYTGTPNFTPWGIETEGTSVFAADGGYTTGSCAIRKISIASGAMTTIASRGTSNDTQDLALYGDALYFVHGGLNAVYTVQ